MKDKSHKLIESLLKCPTFEVGYELLKKFKEEGGSKADAEKLLEETRLRVDSETEDVVLELLDIVTGFCSFHLKIW